MVITDTLVFPLITFQIYNVFRYKNLVLHFDTTIQSQYTSSQAHTIQVSWSRAAPACREHFRGEFRSKSLQVFTASLGAPRKPQSASAPKQSILVKHIFADLINYTKKRRVYYFQCHLPKLAVGRHPSCAEDRVTVSARALTPARSSQPQGPPTKHQESNIHIRAAR
jgi:hypothetical protein